MAGEAAGSRRRGNLLYSRAVNPLLSPLHARRNFRLGVLNGMLYTLAETLIDPTLVLVAFVSHLTASPILIGLVAPLRDAGWFLPQLWMSGYIQSLPVKLSIYRPTAVVRLAAWGALAVLALAAPSPAVLLVGFFLAFGTYAVVSGVSGLAFMEVVGKTIAPPQRAVFYAWRLFTGGLAGLGAAALVRWLLGDPGAPAFPRNFGLLFGLGWVAAALGLGAFGLIREPADPNPPPRAQPREQLRRALAVLRAHPNFRRFLYLRASLIIAGAPVPFFAVFAREQLGAPLTMVGTYLSAYTVASLLTNVLVGRFAARLGNRRIMQLGAAATVLMSASVAAMAAAAPGLPASGGSAALWLVPAFVLLGVRETCLGIAGQSLLLDIAPAGDRSLYVGFTNSVLGVVLLSTVLSGVVVATLGFPALLVLGLVAGVTALAAGRRVADPQAPA